jgi:hypothetical protein
MVNSIGNISGGGCTRGKVSLRACVCVCVGGGEQREREREREAVVV